MPVFGLADAKFHLQGTAPEAIGRGTLSRQVRGIPGPRLVNHSPRTPPASSRSTPKPDAAPSRVASESLSPAASCGLSYIFSQGVTTW